MAYTPMFETWRVDMEGVPFDITLDLGRGEDYPLKYAPWFFGVRVPMADRQEDGTPTRDEERRLDVVENRIRALLRDREGIYVGRRTGANNRDLLFYMPERPRGVEDRIRASVGMEILFISRDDRRWVGYEQLLPTPKDFHQIEEQRNIEEYLAEGYDPERVYEIIHTISVPIQKGAEAIGRLCQKLDLDPVDITGEAPEITVTAHHLLPLKADAIASVTYILKNKVPKARGIYMGWVAEDTANDVVETPETEDDLMALLSNLARTDA